MLPLALFLKDCLDRVVWGHCDDNILLVGMCDCQYGWAWVCLIFQDLVQLVPDFKWLGIVGHL